MKTGNKALAILAGVFLILHALLYVFFDLIPWLSSPSLPEPDLVRRLCIALILPAVGVFLLRQQPKIAAVLMTVLAAVALFCYAEEIACYLSETPPTAAAARYAVGGHFPARFFVIPLIELTAALLLAAQFYTRGFAALLIPLFVAAAEIAAAHGTLERFAYVAGGHPSPLNYLMPFNYVLASVLIGMYLVTANPMLNPGETSDGHSDQ